ncbi:hypothetical protein ACHAXR_005333 [Thalassiosira sp. AJA248-18]
MDDTICSALEEGGAEEELDLWRYQRDRLNEEYENVTREKDGKSKKKVRVHPMILQWAIVAFLARTSASVYGETAEMVSAMADKAYAINIDTIRCIGERAKRDKWTKHQQTGVLAQDSANVNAGIQHDYVSNTLVGLDESHRLGNLTHMFQLMAQQVRDNREEEAEQDAEGSSKRPQNSIMDELKLAHEHLVFKWTSMDPNINCCFDQYQQGHSRDHHLHKTEMLPDTMPIYGLECAMEVSDAAGCNWVAFKDTMSTHSISDVLPKDTTDKYPAIDFDIMCVTKDPVTDEWFIFLPDMPHLTKNIVTALELSSKKKSKRNIKYGLCPCNLLMAENIWLETGGVTGQMHETKLTIRHFDKNAHSRMNVKLAMQVLSASVARMIREAIADNDITLQLKRKGMYNHLADLYEKWNTVADICNGRDGPHSPSNAVERQTVLLDILDWFSKWKAKHDSMVQKKEATEYNFFADETWFCIRSLLLAHVAAIEIYCVRKSVSINPSSMNTDTVEWFFGDARTMLDGSTNKLPVLGFNHADTKQSAFNAARCNLQGNNATGENIFGRKNFF